MSTVLETLTALAQRFDAVAAYNASGAKHGFATRADAKKARKNAAQLRFVAALTTRGVITTSEAWIWADTAAGQLIKDHDQIERKAGIRG